ncbi:MAG: MFS transporter, partial [Bacteroidales bacterium]|nr:MFS transporter [Bacteroidales bacterium]
MDTKMSFKNLLPLLGLTCAAFIFNTSEFIPIGLLSDIADDFSTTEAHAGMLISVYAWIVMLLSLPLMLLVSKIELRKLMLCTIVMFMVCQLLSSFSTTYSMLMAS